MTPTNQHVNVGPTQRIPVGYNAGSIYIAGPMTGRPFFNRAAFDAAEARLKRDHWKAVFNPVNRDVAVYGEGLFENAMGDIAYAKERYGFDKREALGADLKWICEEADALYMLTGWQGSSGARAEMAVAEALGLMVFHENYYPLDMKIATYYVLEQQWKSKKEA